MTEAEHLDDAQVQEKWREIAPLIDRMIERVGTQGDFRYSQVPPWTATIGHPTLTRYRMLYECA